MKKVYICSPYASQGDRKQNVANAIEYCRMAIMRGFIPIAPHVFYTQMLNDDIEAERAAGLAIGIELLKECEEIWVFGPVKGGMIAEVQKAKEIGIEVLYVPVTFSPIREGGERPWQKA